MIGPKKQQKNSSVCISVDATASDLDASRTTVSATKPRFHAQPIAVA